MAAAPPPAPVKHARGKPVLALPTAVRSQPAVLDATRADRTLTAMLYGDPPLVREEFERDGDAGWGEWDAWAACSAQGGEGRRSPTGQACTYGCGA
ncbi:hypothetical protein AMAG_19583 [Allomyces macrogynus ATCC 38327]|uniref:Uncharacterized protein n=1 Tax=Allomyces macrogynus (strain ATCC 38327) TaxID=578462 RepID=A0A0L0SVM0_ALLM3|nr:hypothetical protein AMAG_19583 [Allomyces macrogynus ATCC 38327]|eukprot:KNE66501.1 hypothetical protein AMAG_19583 [Allomyces macrogynus ATCC 38327]